MLPPRTTVVVALGAALCGGMWSRVTHADEGHHHHHRGRVLQQVIVPGEDRFTPFGVTVRPGDAVRWVNQDTDDHTVVSDDAFNNVGITGVNHLLPGTDSNGGQPGVFILRFDHPGQFVYYCRFHSHLDAHDQPVAPGPDGGIQDPDTGNFGTPMMGVITVLDDDD
jgi:plastocyanin